MNTFFKKKPSENEAVRRENRILDTEQADGRILFSVSYFKAYRRSKITYSKTKSECEAINFGCVFITNKHMMHLLVYETLHKRRFKNSPIFFFFLLSYKTHRSFLLIFLRWIIYKYLLTIFGPCLNQTFSQRYKQLKKAKKDKKKRFNLLYKNPENWVVVKYKHRDLWVEVLFNNATSSPERKPSLFNFQ